MPKPPAQIQNSVVRKDAIEQDRSRIIFTVSNNRVVHNMSKYMYSIKVMPDYDCFPLWLTEGQSLLNIDPKVLPLSNETIQRLYRWSEWYTSTLNRDDPLSSGFATASEEETFEQEGKALWQQLRVELGTDYDISYNQWGEYPLL